MAVLHPDENIGDLLACNRVSDRLSVPDAMLLQLFFDELHIVRLAVILDFVDLAGLLGNFTEGAFQDLRRVDARNDAS